ncbi:hypothetical protein Ptr902_12005 [Pyrenophora tritici-repentis]|nr:hypothetical protein Ptr902_12005 [Pyrenophora tritici-repentis]
MSTATTSTPISPKLRRQTLAPYRHPWPRAEIAPRTDSYLTQAFHIILTYIHRPNRAGLIDDVEYKNYLITLVQIAKMVAQRHGNFSKLGLDEKEWGFFDEVVEEVKGLFPGLDLGLGQLAIKHIAAGAESDAGSEVQVGDEGAVTLEGEVDGEPGKESGDVEVGVCKSEEAEAEEQDRISDERRAERTLRITALREEIAQLTRDIDEMTLQKQEYESTGSA